MRAPVVVLASLSVLIVLACERGTTPPTSEPKPEVGAVEASEAGQPIDAAAIVAADDRDASDVEADVRRKPVELLEFLDLRTGMKVADIGAGFGYTTELLARAVGPSGKVYGQNTPFVLDRFARDGWNARLAKPINQNVVSLEREFDDPFPDDIEPLDRVVNVLFYHDFEWMKVDRAKHVADVFAALRPGGLYVIVDASAAEGHGAQDSQTLHRIEQALLVRELEAGGFELIEEGEFLRNPSDTRDWNGLPWESTEKAGEGVFSDKFVLKFRKAG
jgi:predicted methyltransferase